MTVSSIAPAIRPALHGAGPDTAAPATASTPEGRALVPVSPVERGADVPRITRPDASFVTHLIAMADHSPQIRVRRRATSQDALAVYGSALCGAAADTQSSRRVLRIA